MPDFTTPDGTTLHYEERGAGEPVALLNGVLMTTASWAFQRAALEPRFRLLLHDFRGQLLSGKPERPWPIEQHSGDFLALLDHLGIERCHVVGTSYGGEVGLIFAAHHPERVRSLAVIASVAHAGPRLREQTEAWALAALSAPETLFDAVAADSYSPAFVRANPALIEAGRARLAQAPPGFLPAFARLVRAFQALDARAALARIACPTLVIAAAGDTLKPPSYSRAIAEGIRGAELAVVADAGHAVVLEQPEAVNALLLRFLGS